MSSVMFDGVGFRFFETDLWIELRRERRVWIGFVIRGKWVEGKVGGVSEALRIELVRVSLEGEETKGRWSI